MPSSQSDFGSNLPPNFQILNISSLGGGPEGDHLFKIQENDVLGLGEQDPVFTPGLSASCPFSVPRDQGSELLFSQESFVSPRPAPPVLSQGPPLEGREHAALASGLLVPGTTPENRDCKVRRPRRTF